jgi:hypothetical protein
VIFEPELETMAREELQALQMERLRGLVAYVKERIPLYRERLAGLEPGDIASLDDLRRLPFTRKDDLRDTYPFGLFAVPREEAVRVQASSGTTGKLTVVGYTAADVELFAVVNARSLAMAGAEPGMMLHNAYGYGLFTGGLGLHYGGERLGLTVVPVSGGLTERQLMLITDFRPDVISCTPSYALTLAQAFAESGVGPDEISLRYAVLGAEPWTERRARLHDADEAGAASRALLDRRHHEPQLDAVLVRPHVRAHEPDHGQGRRHAHHPRRQRLPDAGRGRAPAGAGADVQLPDRRHALGHARRGRGGSRSRRRRARRRRAQEPGRAAPSREHRLLVRRFGRRARYPARRAGSSSACSTAGHLPDVIRLRA